MKTFLVSIGLLAYACGVWGGEAIVTTVVVRGFVTNNVGGHDWIHSTNVVAIPNGQAARVAMVVANDDDAKCVKDGVSWSAAVGHVVQGPCDFIVTAYGDTASVVTLERWTVKKAK
jgi:hypothetical protein